MNQPTPDPKAIFASREKHEPLPRLVFRVFRCSGVLESGEHRSACFVSVEKSYAEDRRPTAADERFLKKEALKSGFHFKTIISYIEADLDLSQKLAVIDNYNALGTIYNEPHVLSLLAGLCTAVEKVALQPATPLS